MRVLVFGGSGFIGAHLVNHFSANGHLVLAPASREADISTGVGVRDVLKAFAPDVVVNLAARSSVTEANEAALYALNAFGHEQLLGHIASECPAAQVILCSSANVYGSNPNGALRETDVPAPVNVYGISKVMAEQFGNFYRDRLSITAVRPFNCVGRGQKPGFLVPKLVDAFRSRVPFLSLGNLNVQRDFVDVRDLCRMWDYVLDGTIKESVVNFGNGRVTSIAELVDILSEITGHRPEIKTEAGLLRANDVYYQCSDSRLLLQAGYTSRFKIEDTLRWMMEG